MSLAVGRPCDWAGRVLLIPARILSRVCFRWMRPTPHAFLNPADHSPCACWRPSRWRASSGTSLTWPISVRSWIPDPGAAGGTCRRLRSRRRPRLHTPAGRRPRAEGRITRSGMTKPRHEPRADYARRSAPACSHSRRHERMFRDRYLVGVRCTSLPVAGFRWGSGTVATTGR
jgi:hypothetical protein